MNQQELNLLTEFVLVTAQQIAIECGNDKPSKQNVKDAVTMVNKYGVVVANINEWGFS